MHRVQEGELRPQLLDRFGLSVIVTTMPSIASRTRMVLDRLAFDQARPHPRRRSAFCQLPSSTATSG